MKNKHFLTILGVASQDFIHNLVAEAENLDCTIDKAKLLEVKEQLSFTLLVSGRWDQMARLETFLQNVKNQAVNLLITRVEESQAADSEDEECYIPYHLSFSTLFETTILNRLLDFCALQGMLIHSLTSEPILTAYGVEVVKISIQLKVPIDVHLLSLREQFNIFCENENLDAKLEQV